MDGISDVALSQLRLRVLAIAPPSVDDLAARVVDVASYHNLSLDAAERYVSDLLASGSPSEVLALTSDAAGDFGRF